MEPKVLWSGQKIGVHDHKPDDPCPRDCPAHPEYPEYVEEYTNRHRRFNEKE